MLALFFGIHFLKKKNKKVGFFLFFFHFTHIIVIVLLSLMLALPAAAKLLCAEVALCSQVVKLLCA